MLFDSIGPRLTGTPQGTQASDWVMKMYRSWGIDAKREQYGTWRGWRRGYSHIDLVKPRVRSLEATMLGYSPGTAGKDVIGTTIILPMVKDSDEFVQWLPNVKGKFVLDLGGISDVPSRRRVAGDGDAGVEGDAWIPRSSGWSTIGRAHSQHRLATSRPEIRRAALGCDSRRPARPA